MTAKRTVIPMLKQIWIAECDMCGRTEEAKAVIGRYTETGYDLPDGWSRAHNKNFILCPECVVSAYTLGKKTGD